MDRSGPGVVDSQHFLFTMRSMARRPAPREMIVFVETDRNLPEPMAKLSIGRLGRFVHGDDIPKAALEARKSWWRIRPLKGRRFEFIEMVDEPQHRRAKEVQRAARAPAPTYDFGKVEWAGVSFVAVGLRDAGLFRGWPGLFAFVRREVSGSLVLLHVEAAEDLANAAGPGNEAWSVALSAGATELHLAVVEGQRVDRRGLVARIARHLNPSLNQAVPNSDEGPGWELGSKSAT